MPNNEDARLEPQIAMRRDDLADLPNVQLPEGYAIRCYQPGDDAAWDRVIGESFGTRPEEREGKFAGIMLSDSAFVPERVLFVIRDGQVVATASAWFRPKLGSDVGYLHYVGVLPSEAGHRLGYQVSLACLHKMVDEGRTCTVLLTDDYRIPAIKTYLKLGFRPLLTHDNQRQRWLDILTRIGRSDLIESFEPILSAPVTEF